jgi:inorganic pyrophosphatase
MFQTYACNPWHYVSSGPHVPEVVNAVIEIKAGSRSKYELHKESGMLKLDRILFSSVHYPTNYGFIPQTYCEDNDPLDILVYCSQPIEPMALVEARVIGVMRMIDGDEQDDKIIAVAIKDESVNHIRTLAELPPHYLKEVRCFFEDYKKLEKKEVQVNKFEEREAGCKTVQDAIELYRKVFNKVAEKMESLHTQVQLP